MGGAQLSDGPYGGAKPRLTSRGIAAATAHNVFPASPSTLLQIITLSKRVAQPTSYAIYHAEANELLNQLVREILFDWSIPHGNP